MPIDSIVVKGSPVNATANFIGFVPSDPPKFKVYDPNSKLILSGNATLNGNNVWSATVTIPLAAPNTDPNQRYLLVWEAKNVNKQYNIQEQFSVSDNIQPAPSDAGVITMENTAFKVEFISQFANIPNASIRIVFSNMETEEYGATASNLVGIPIPGGFKYSFTIPALANLNAGNMGLKEAWAVINYIDSASEQYTEYQPVYFANLSCLHLMNAVRRQVDRIRNKDIIPQLRVTEIDLMYAVLQGISKINSVPPLNFKIGLAGMGIPDYFQHYVVVAASIVLLRAMYLGEGMSAFSFNGLSVTLESDRTQYIQSMLSELQNDMGDLKEAKTGLAKAGWNGSGRSVGTIGTFVGPLRNYGGVAQMSAGYTANLYGGYPSLPFWI